MDEVEKKKYLSKYEMVGYGISIFFFGMGIGPLLKNSFDITFKQKSNEHIEVAKPDSAINAHQDSSLVNSRTSFYPRSQPTN